MLLNRLRLGPRLTLGFGAMLLLMLVMAALSLQKLGTLQQHFEDVSQMQALATRADEWRALVDLNLSRSTATFKSGGNAQVSGYFDPKIKATSESISTLQKDLVARLTDARSRELLDEIAARRKTYLGTREQAFALLKKGDTAAVAGLLDQQLLPQSEQYVGAIAALRGYEQQRVDAQSATTKADMRNGMLQLAALCVLCCGFAVGLAWSITRSVTLPLRRAVAATEAIATGDLSQSIAAVGKDETAELLQGVAAMQRALRQLVSDVHNSTQSIATASSEIAIGSGDLASRTEHTASNLQQTASSMEQLTGTVKQSADAARTANQLAASAAAVAAKGGTVVSQVVATMDEINSSSRRIGDIVGVIDSIAFQTNILALNAAVEAARAGTQGRGFAVVASEVRGLAQRSAEAAKEIKALIGVSVGKVESGARLVGDAGATMNEIVESVQRVTDVIAEISAASSEQSSGIGQVNGAVIQLDQMTQQNAALVEQSAAAAESLKDQARNLAQLVSTFKLERDALPA